MERDVLSIKVDQHAAVSKCGLEIEKMEQYPHFDGKKFR
jgi:hypothetical protein